MNPEPMVKTYNITSSYHDEAELVIKQDLRRIRQYKFYGNRSCTRVRKYKNK